MKYIEHYPRHLEKKYIKKFAIFPIKINNIIKWLEIVYIEIIFYRKYGNTVNYWQYNKFINKNEYKLK